MSTVLVNVAKKSEEASVYFPKFLHDILKDHQIDGTRFLFQRCIGSVEKVKAGDRGKGCILAHSMGLGKTLQVHSVEIKKFRNSQLTRRSFPFYTSP